MKKFSIFVLLLFLCSPVVFAQGKVYLVLGSDTGIWSGASTSTLHCYYNHDLYSDPSGNTYAVMDQTFREKIAGSDGKPLKLTWWMHGGNMFRYARNNNVPYSNTIALHLMKKYHADAISSFGDELTLHYHTWDWTDYDMDGIFYWNQTPDFNDCREDFDWTLAQYLLEEEVFPVSFRSGWHYMDNNWQNYIDELLPFSLHNDYPNKHIDTVEPLDNLYDWSRCSPFFEPFHPSLEDYQVAGEANGWNVRSIYTMRATPELLTEVFQRARDGSDQVVCIWSHLPEADFPAQIETVHERVTAVHANFPDVGFYYYTAIEAMQAWLKTEDSQGPILDIREAVEVAAIKLTIQTDEPIFQKQPIVAVKDIYEQFRLLDCQVSGVNRWEAFVPMGTAQVARVGIAVTDTAGNQSIRILRYLPEDIFIDNTSDGLTPVTPNYTLQSASAWGTDALRFDLAAGDSASASADISVPEKRRYRLFTQFAPVTSPVDSFSCLLFRDGELFFQRTISGLPADRTWIYLTTTELDPGSDYTMTIKSINTSTTSRQFSPDGIKISAMIPERLLVSEPAVLNFGTVSIFDTAKVILKISNHGEKPLTVNDLKIESGLIYFEQALPLEIVPFGTKNIELQFFSDQIIILEDTLWIHSDDPVEPVRPVPVSVSATEYFELIDNEDVLQYQEFGDWQTSNAQAFGPSSRYVYLNDGAGTYAEFTTVLKKSGLYDLLEIVPKTVNATDNALYEIRLSGTPLDSVYLDQNSNSGIWCAVGRYYFPANVPVQVRVINTGVYSVGVVLRADALKLQLVQEINDIAEHGGDHLPRTTRLFQNYPNPFNPNTRIRYEIGTPGRVLIEILDITGRMVRVLKDGNHLAGNYEVAWDGLDNSGMPVASGIYFCLLQSGVLSDVRKMILVR